jgi:hypothetical protein
MLPAASLHMRSGWRLAIRAALGCSRLAERCRIILIR